MNMYDIPPTFYWAVVVLILGLLFFIIFKKSINNLIDRIQSTKFPGGIEASFSPNEKVNINEDKEKIIKEMVSTNTKSEENSFNVNNEEDSRKQETQEWIDEFENKNFPKAFDLLKIKIQETTDINKKIQLTSVSNYIQSKVDFDEAINQFEKLVENHPKNESVYYWYSMVYVEIKIKRAIEILNQGFKHTNQPSLLNHAARILISGKQFEQAKEKLEQIISNSDFENYQIALAYVNLGNLAKLENDKENVKLYVVEAYLLQPKNDTILERISDLLFDVGESNLELFFREKLLEIDSKNTSNLGRLGNCYLVLDFIDNALELYEMANKLDNDKQSWHVANIGNVYSNCKLYSKAQDYFQKAYSLDPDIEYNSEGLASVLRNIEKNKKRKDEIINEGLRFIDKVSKS